MSYSAYAAQHCPAKINIFLHVKRKREDNYHELNSLAVFTSFGDRLVLSSSEKWQVAVSGPYAEQLQRAGGDKIIHQIRDELIQLGISLPPLCLELEKNIPLGGGLGGGSTNGAAFLRAVYQHNAHTLSPSHMIAIAQKVGADIPVCLTNTFQLMEGIGEKLTAVAVNTPLPFCVLANPHRTVSTQAVFSALQIQKDYQSPSISEVQQLIDAQKWKTLIGFGNHLQEAALRYEPQIGFLLDEMRKWGQNCAEGEFFGAAMSGSGASCFALFDNEADAKQCAAALKDAGFWAVDTRLISN